MIVGVAVVNRSTDQREVLTMEKQVAQRAGHHPGAYLVDGGFVDLEDIRTLERVGVHVYAQPKGQKGRTGGALEAWH